MFTDLGWLILLALIVGSVLEPIRIYQAITGRIYLNDKASQSELRKAVLWFYLALPFWCAFLWAIWNIKVIKSCSGDNCMGYSLLAFPFPFLYGIGEVILYGATKTRRTIDK